jgi:tRNA threonylcarbamoyladenosine biosynthesis protein TsaB
LGRLSGQGIELGRDLEVLEQVELEGRSYSATLVSAVAELLARNKVTLRELCAIVTVHGPGSFTGVRVGLSAVKGFAEPAEIPVVAVSRLAVLAMKGNVSAAALDAHRHEVYLRVATRGETRELLAGAAELSVIEPPQSLAVCDQAAADVLAAVWPGTDLVGTEAPTAADAMRMSVPLILAGELADLALMDGHYLRRSDAEIFGLPGAKRP